jgi:hypothetical protein
MSLLISRRNAAEAYREIASGEELKMLPRICGMILSDRRPGAECAWDM